MASSNALGKPEAAPIRIAIEDFSAHMATVEAELKQGRVIELTQGEAVIADVRGREPAVAAGRVELPDFMAMLREIYGDKPLDVDTTEWIREERDGRRAIWIAAS